MMEKANAIFIIVMAFLAVAGVSTMGFFITRDAYQIVKQSKEQTKALEKRRQDLAKRKVGPNA